VLKVFLAGLCNQSEAKQESNENTNQRLSEYGFHGVTTLAEVSLRLDQSGLRLQVSALKRTERSELNKKKSPS